MLRPRTCQTPLAGQAPSPEHPLCTSPCRPRRASGGAQGPRPTAARVAPFSRRPTHLLGDRLRPARAPGDFVFSSPRPPGPAPAARDPLPSCTALPGALSAGGPAEGARGAGGANQGGARCRGPSKRAAGCRGVPAEGAEGADAGPTPWEEAGAGTWGSCCTARSRPHSYGHTDHEPKQFVLSSNN